MCRRAPVRPRGGFALPCKKKGQFVSRAGEKLSAALDAFDIDVTGRICADFGCNVGGFTDCLLQRSAAKVCAIDTGYGTLAWRLRGDPRVVVMERTNALHCPVREPADLVVVDVAWTPQERILPAAMRWLKGSEDPASVFPCVVSLLKPHYELAQKHGRRPDAALTNGQAEEICQDVCHRLTQSGYAIRGAMRSPIRGKGGNVEFLLLAAEVSAISLNQDVE